MKRWNKNFYKPALVALVILTAMAWISPMGQYTAQSENEFIKSLKIKLAVFNGQLPEERVYLQFDKPMYEPGDDIWFSAFVRDGATLKPSAKSDIVHVELINPKGTVEKYIKLIAGNGVAAGDFKLDSEALGGLYKVRAYTNWMKNEGDKNAFEKEIQVQQVILPNLKMKLDFEKKAFGSGDEVIAKIELNTNENKALANYKLKFVANLDGKQFVAQENTTDDEGIRYIKFQLPANLKSTDGLLNVMIDYNGITESISRSIPIVLNNIKLAVYPEGGDLVQGIQCKVAFRAVNEFGKPADVEGVVLTANGSQVASFSSFHMGMGSFNINPQASEKYHIKITKPEGINETIALPEALPRGYVMNIDNSRKGELSVNIITTETEELAVVAQVRGKIFYNTAVQAKEGHNRITFSTADFPMGVSQITLFDSKGIARAERLAFLNKGKQLSVSIETDKQKYLPREKVRMTVSVKDERGMPMPANLSVAVVNDQLLSFADDKSGNILSQLLLERDIKEKIEEPAFYFSAKEKKADEALDYLMMTAGWRRFAWEKIMTDNIPQITYQGEQAILAGMVKSATTGKPIANARIKLSNGSVYTADASGNFVLKNVPLYDPINMQYTAVGYNPQSGNVADYNRNIVMYMYDAGAAQRGSRVVEDEAVQLDHIQLAPASQAMFAMPVELASKRSANNVAKLSKVVASESVKAKDMPAREVEKKEVQNIAGNAADFRASRFDMANEESDAIKKPQATLYYRARQFAAPQYKEETVVDTRTDFRNTIYWNPNVEVSRTGKQVIEFYASDDITSFRTTVEGIAADGAIGRTEMNFFTQLPFAMTTKIPVEVATEDKVSIPLTLKNNTDAPLGGELTITAPDGLKAIVQIPSTQTIMPGAAKTIYLDYQVLDKIGFGEFIISFKACGLGDSFSQMIKIAPKGFPVTASFSGQEIEKDYMFETNNVVNGSLKMSFTAFPSVVDDLMKGVEGILREPYGCFEQTSATAYPNAMVLDYLKATGSKDDKTMAYASNLLDKGYKRLTTFETKQNGYEWFGASPAHEGLTAYGIMEFVDMKNAGGDVDQKMIDRTAKWIMNQKDGKGGFAREKRAYHDFGRISDDIMNGYIVYALAEAGYIDIKKEFETSYQKAMATKDAYALAMAANAAYRLGDTRKAEAALELLLKQQAKDGSFTGSTHSITYSQGKSLTIETTSIAIMAMLKESGKYTTDMNKSVQFLVGARSGSGVFSSSQGTILALKALTGYAKYSKKANEDGAIAIYIDGKKVATKAYKAGEKGEVNIDGLEAFVKGNGKHDVKVKYMGVKNPLPYSVAVSWSTTLPVSDPQCAINLTTTMAAKIAKVGETVRMTATITNRKNEEVPSTMAIIGIPAGFTLQPWQLKEMQEKKVFDYYEIMGNNIAIYYRGMAPSAVKQLHFDLKAEMPGEYDAPASSAYLYYTNEFKTWSGVEKVTIRKS